MATIEKQVGKNGTTYRITVYAGFDTQGKRIRHRMNYKPTPGMTPRQIEKAAQKAAMDFERSIEQGFALDNRQTFAEYAAYVLDLKQRTGTKARTLDRYQDMMVRINQAIGHIKLADLRPQHLNSFYKNLAEPGIRIGGGSAKAKIDMVAWLKKNKLSRGKLAEKAGIAAATVGVAVKGESIKIEKAQAIAQAMEKKVDDVFKVERNMEPLADKTILEHHRLISTILAQAEKEMVDERKIALNPAYELSFLKKEEQEQLLDAMDSEQATPSLSQAQRLKKFSQEGHLTPDVMSAIMSEEKKSEWDRVTLTSETLRKYFPKSYTPKKMQETIVKLLEAWQRQRQREQER